MRKKDSRIQVIRGILTIFVVLGHAILPSIRTESVPFKVMFTVIYSFHMFAFFFVSGWVNSLSYKRRTEKIGCFIRKKIKRLLIPFWIFTLLAFGVYLMAGNVQSISQLLGNETITVNRIATALLFDINNIDSHLWFIFQLFFIQIIAEVFKKKKHILLIVVGILNLFPYYTGAFASCIPSIIKYLIPYLGGELFGERYFNIDGNISEQVRHVIGDKKMAILAVTVLCAMNIVLLQIDIDSADRLLISLDRVIRIVSGCAGTFLVLILGCRLQKSSFLASIGDHSFEIYLMHQPFIVNGVGQMLMKLDVWIPLSVMITTIIGILVPVAVSEQFLKRITIGRIAIGGQGGKDN